jgi:HEPN domain-containing protein
MAPEALRWLAVAGQDLKAVRNNILGPEPALDIAAYHCQQAAEKITKAALIVRGIDPPRWHDIDSLITLLGGTEPLAALLAPLIGLTPYGIAFRYPVPFWCTEARGRGIPLLFCFLTRRGRSPGAEHAIEGLSGNLGFDLLGRPALGAQGAADHSLVSAHRGLRLGPLIVARSLLPAHAAALGDDLEMVVARRRIGFRRRARHRRGGTITAASGWCSAMVS